MKNNNLNYRPAIKIKSIIILIFFTTLNFSLLTLDSYSQWYYQALPSYYSIADVKFFDANTGLMIFTTEHLGMLRTTNGGNNWTLIHNALTFYQLERIDSMALYVNCRYHGANRIYRTFDRGLTWDSVSLTSSETYQGLSFINCDTGWISGYNYLNYHCIWRSTNGGSTLIQMTDEIGGGKPFFLKQKVNGEYIGWHYSYWGDELFWKTTNNGVSWFQATRPPAQYPGYFEFYNENTGWFTGSGTGGGMYKSTNGGLNWTLQTLPTGTGIHSFIYRFKIINADTLYGVGGYKTFPNNIDFGLIWKTTSSGVNWGYQLPDTTFNIGGFGSIDFINAKTGWAYQGHGVHTTNGGGPIIYTDIHNRNEIVSKDYILFQNYPNPFNQLTIIKYQLSITATAKLEIFNIKGEKILTLVNEKKTEGKYSARFDAGNLSSGIYFYVLSVAGKAISTKKMILLK